MPNRTEMLHFRATPEEKQTIRENAGHAELALSEWMRQRSLNRANLRADHPLEETVDEGADESPLSEPDFDTSEHYEDPVTRENKAKIRQACEEGKPVDVQVVPGSLVPTQPAVEERRPIVTSPARTFAEQAKRPIPDIDHPETLTQFATETYEQFMERRVGELVSDEDAPMYAVRDAEQTAREGWAQR